MTNEELTKAAVELAATCETSGVDDPETVDDAGGPEMFVVGQVERLGLVADPWHAPPEEERQAGTLPGRVPPRVGAACGSGRQDENARRAFEKLAAGIDYLCQLWHENHSILEEFWTDFECCSDLDTLEEYLKKGEEKIRRGVVRTGGNWGPAGRRQARERERKRQELEKILLNLGEGHGAILAKARLLRDRRGLVGLAVMPPAFLLVRASDFTPSRSARPAAVRGFSLAGRGPSFRARPQARYVSSGSSLYRGDVRSAPASSRNRARRVANEPSRTPRGRKAAFVRGNRKPSSSAPMYGSRRLPFPVGERSPPARRSRTPQLQSLHAAFDQPGLHRPHRRGGHLPQQT